jgi:hypothetical protein
MTGTLRILIALVGALASQSLAGAAEPPAPAEPRSWYILAQTDTTGLLHGLPQRLAEASAPGPRFDANLKDVPGGGHVRVTVEYDGNVQGPAMLGFFNDPRWSTGEVRQLRTCPGPGVHTLENVAPGDYCLGAMVGKAADFAAATSSPPDGCGLGVDDVWPRTFSVRAGETTDVRLRVSHRFQFGLNNGPDVLRGTFGPPKDGAAGGVRIQSLDADGRPLPFCHVMLSQLAVNRPYDYEALYEVGTDVAGVGWCKEIQGKFRATIQTIEILPDRLEQRFVGRSFPTIYETSSPNPVALAAPAFPVGTATLEGRVHNQFGEPLREFYMTLSQQKEFGKFDSRYFSIKAPFIDDDGRYQIPNLPPGAYTVMIRHFDYPTHVYRNAGHAVVVPDEADAIVAADFQVEAKELLYGHAVYEDGAPVAKGGWMARFTQDPRSPSGGEYFSLGTEPDGRFRVCLSQAERRQVLDNFAGMVDVFATTADNKRTTLKIHIDELSRIGEAPTRVVFTRSAP